jgi:hypothetical protein
MNIYPPKRYQKAMNLTAHVMHVLNKHLHYTQDKGAIAKDLNDLFYTAGVEVITEADRINAGLSPRNHEGLTLEEIAILDARYAKAMLEPMKPLIFENKETK